MAESKKKCRQYSVDYLKFGFIPSLSDKQLPMCIVCNKVLSNDAMKSSKLEDHLRRCHPDKIVWSKNKSIDKLKSLLPSLLYLFLSLTHRVIRHFSAVIFFSSTTRGVHLCSKAILAMKYISFEILKLISCYTVCKTETSRSLEQVTWFFSRYTVADFLAVGMQQHKFFKRELAVRRTDVSNSGFSLLVTASGERS
ncbi:hypothetical protein NQ318_012365 [Aromia moschata]|uniref:BED-type domain-containing protein n=1 Tax=Aromia moschata TaxID=1265417 RepID=A0AAV8XJE0_9CUCU|nr:hypothetical protein NQ318_012365 [Aromia moschata]